jgi:hypothetical protein
MTPQDVSAADFQNRCVFEPMIAAASFSKTPGTLRRQKRIAADKENGYG